MITEHQFLKKYPISRTSEKLIVGTIHPHNCKDFKTQFFYGNENSLWNILSEAFPTELEQPITLNGILEFLERRRISMSDTIVKCRRKTNSALDKDLEPLDFNKGLIDQIKKSNVTEIFFTSGFGKNNAFNLFYAAILGFRITRDIRELRYVLLPKEVLGKEVKLTVLYSPARTANVGLSKSKLYLANKSKFINSKRPVHDFKVWYYRQMFSY